MKQVASPSSRYAIEIKNVTKEYTIGKNKLCAVKNLQLQIQEGEIFGLLGPNGAGKSTIISMLSGLKEASSGTISIKGHNIQESPKNVKYLLGVMPQEVISHGFFTVNEVLKFYSGYYGIWDNQEWIMYLLKRIQLWPQKDKKVNELSGGMKRRLLLAKALLNRPKILLLDEPSAGVDIELRSILWNFIKELNQQGTTILLTTHYIEEAEKLCNRITVINNGELLYLSPTKSLIDKLTHRVFELILKKPLPPLSSSFVLSQNRDKIILKLPHQTDLGKCFKEMNLDLENLQDIRIQEGSLEQALIEILQQMPYGK